MKPRIGMFIKLIIGVALLLGTTLSSFSLAQATLVSAVLPASRSVQVGDAATAFGVLINGGTITATSCRIAQSTDIQATFSYQTTDSLNAPIGSPNTPIDIPAGGIQFFIFSLTPTTPFAPTDVALNFTCTNTASASSTVGLNTLLLSASATPVPDIVALVGTPTNDGITHLPGATGGIGNTSVFVVASVNVGATGTITASADTGTANLPLAITLCQTDTATGACLAPPSASITTNIAANATPSFGVFVEGVGLVLPDPAINRLFIRFKDQGGLTRGSTNVAVQTDGPAPLVITTAVSLPSGTATQPYNATLTTSGGTAPFSWSVIAGSLPGGLTLNGSTSQISGTATTAGTFIGTLQVQDSSIIQQSAQQPFSLTIASIPTGGGGGSLPPGTATTVLPGPFTSSAEETIPEIAVADLNQDGLLDVLVSVTDFGAATFKAFINQGDRTFTDQTDVLFPVAQNPSIAMMPFWISKFYTVDMNGDGRVDVIANTSNPGMGVVDRIFIQLADGTYAEEPVATFPNLNIPTPPPFGGQLITNTDSAFPIDVDNDGDFDLLKATLSGSGTSTPTLVWYLLENTSANGVLSFTVSNAPMPSFAGIDQIAFIDDPVVADLNHDGFMDFIYAGPQFHGGFVDQLTPIKVLLNDGALGFTDGTASVMIDGTIPLLIQGGSLVAGDFNADAVVDVLIAGGGFDAAPFSGERNMLLLSQPNGLYLDSKTTSPAFTTPHMTHSLAVGDLNRDGALDIIFSDIVAGQATELGKVLLNDGAGNFTMVDSPFPNAADYGTEGGDGSLNAWTATKIADMDNDGWDDVILGAQFPSTQSIIYWNDTSGTGVFH